MWSSSYCIDLVAFYEQWKKYLHFSGDEGGSSATSSQTKNPRMSSLTILGLQLTVPSLEKISVFNDKEVLRSATALGYIAHVSSVLWFSFKQW